MDLFQEVLARDQHEYKAGHRQQRGHGIEPHSEWAWKVGPRGAEQQQSHGLHQELQHNANRDQGGD